MLRGISGQAPKPMCQAHMTHCWRQIPGFHHRSTVRIGNLWLLKMKKRSDGQSQITYRNHDKQDKYVDEDIFCKKSAENNF
jgi:hypothetical protein